MNEPRRVTFELPAADGVPARHVGALVWGPDDGPPALCLHGFPDTAWTWRLIAPALVAEGWRVVAPFSRGYAPTGPAPDGCYQVGALVRDVVDLRARLAGRYERAALIGHDWGALTAYGVGDFAPEGFERVVALAVPPVPTLRRVLGAVGPGELLLGLRQLRNSWYMLANQLPGVSERAFGPLVRRLWADWSPGYDATEDLEHLFAALPDLAHRSAAVSYYRAALQPWQRSARYLDEQRAVMSVPIAPTLYLHGDRDGCVRPEFARHVERDLGDEGRAVVVPGAGHFLQLEQPDVVAGEIVRFLR